ncbi:hypothetical protein ACSBR1_036137 [Camellia fascicularis]
MTSSMIGGLISSNVRNKPLASVSVVVCDFKDYYGIEVSYQRTWMGVEKARGSIFGDYSLSFDDFRWYVDAANDANPRSVFDMEFDVDSKGRHFKSESYGNWHWFLSKLLIILTPRRDMAFVIDRHEGLLKALAKVCVYASTIELFNELFEEFKGRCGRTIQQFLKDLPNEHWCNAYFQGKKYGEMCTNAMEFFNSWIRDERHLFSTSLVDAVQMKLMKQFSNKREVRNKWNHIVCLFVEKNYCDSYLHSIYPVPSMWKPNVVDDDVVLPSLCKRPAGHPRIERILSKVKIKRIRCSRCKKMRTNNQKTCKEALA